MKAEQSVSNREYPKPDNYLARVVALTNLAIQPGFEWQGEMTKPSPSLEITYELVSTDMADGRPFWVSERVTNKTTSKKLVQRCMATGVSMERLEGMLDKPVMVTVTHTDKGYPRVSNVAGVPAGIPVPSLRNPTQIFDPYDPDQSSLELFNKFPDFKKSDILSAINIKETPFYAMYSEEEADVPY